jgi:plasmid stabilization system protein ParE
VNAVVFAREFRSDLQAQTRRLVADERADWAIRLMDEIDSAARLLAATPQVGVVELRKKGREVRRLLLRTVPFVLWYSLLERKVVVLRLFHVRQSGSRR